MSPPQGLTGAQGLALEALLLGRRLQTGQVPGQTRQRALHFALANNEAAPRRVQVPRARAAGGAASSLRGRPLVKKGTVGRRHQGQGGHCAATGRTRSPALASARGFPSV